MADLALSGVKVVDLTHYITGPYCTKLFADYGADVIKIEKPGEGDPARRIGPFFKDEPHPEKSGLFLFLNTNKRGITLNLKSETGKMIFKQMVKQADILVESFSPRVMPSLGLQYEVCEKINPTLVMASISNFGQTGPYRDYKASEAILYGMGGEMYSCGVGNREPIKMAGTIVQYEAGASSAAAVMGAFLGARMHEVGQYVDISIMETLAGGIDRRSCFLLAYAYSGDQQPRFGGSEVGFPGGVYPCADGYFDCTIGRELWDRMVKMLGEPEYLKDPKWLTDEAWAKPELREELRAFLLSWTMEHTREEIFQICQASHVICAPLNTVKDLFTDPHLKERGFFTEINHPITGRLRYPGRPFIMSETPWEVRRPAPLLGEHNEVVYGKLGYTKEDLVRLRETRVI